jgi:glycosyltransferase involved in cell wall biosynthesis
VLGLVAHEAYSQTGAKYLHEKNNRFVVRHLAQKERKTISMLKLAIKAINRWRRIYHLKRQGKYFLEKHANAPITHYNESPRVTAIVQLFNKRQNIESIVAGLLVPVVDEIIVIDDGSSDGALEVLPRILTGKNHFVIRSNDIFEIRTYSRALDFARGEIVALLQDDDIPPPDGAWVTDAVELFNRHPKLAVLGGRDGLELKLNDARTVSGGTTNPIGYRAVNERDGHRIDLPFGFVEVINRAPMLVRRQTIQQLGGIDNTFAPFQCDDVDLCLRTWKAGFQVGLYSTGFVRDVGMGGMRLFNADKMGPQARKNWGIIYDRYGRDIANGYFADCVAQAAASLRSQNEVSDLPAHNKESNAVLQERAAITVGR